MLATDAVFKAIAHPARREILALLSVSTRSVKELTARFEMSQPAISQHLKELREAQLVVAERAGLEQRYRLTPAPLKAVLDWSAPYRKLIDPAGHFWAFTKADPSPRAERKRGGSDGC
jgi:DNA-binding transcriptional ArsR family regulator